MMKSIRVAGTALAAVLLLSGYSVQSFAAQPPGYNDRDRDRAWDAPPDEFRSEIQQRGFRDGIEGARKDFENHRSPDVNRRDEYRHPQNVPGGLRNQYREAFRRGYEVGVRRMTEHRDDDRDRDRR